MKRMLVLPAAVVLAACGEGVPKDALSPSLLAGKSLVEENCRVCHAQGISGAPILGNKTMWGPRLSQGRDTLIQHAIEGFNYDMMPARGGNPELTDSDIGLAVDYMISLVQ